MITLAEYLAKYPRKEGGYQPKPTCQTCDGTGFIRGDYDLSHPMFGKIFPCPACNAAFVEQQDEYGLYPSERRLTWEDVIDLSDSISDAKRAVAATLDCGWGWVYLYGGYGTSKTQLLKTAVAEFLKTKQAVYINALDMFDTIRAAYDKANPAAELKKKLEWYSAIPLLALDEFDKAGESPFVVERRFQILDRRYELATRQNYGITLIAGNNPPDSLPGAIRSRVLDARFAVVNAGTFDLRAIAKGLDGNGK